MKKLLLLLLFVIGSYAQTVTFPTIPLPTGIAVFGEYNQLGIPKWMGGASAIYPLAGSLGLYGTTTADMFPKLAYSSTGTRFYALSISARQGIHKDIFNTGRWSFLVGADLGPSIGTSSTTSAVSVNFSSSITTTVVYQFKPAISFMVPIRLLYVDKQGWNPVFEAGVIVNLLKLPKPKI